MAKLFTMVTFNGYKVLAPGFLVEDGIVEIQGLINEVEKTPTDEHVSVGVYHLAFLDFEDAPEEPTTDEEIEILYDELDNYFDAGYIQTLGEYHFKAAGVFVDEIIEMGSE